MSKTHYKTCLRLADLRVCPSFFPVFPFSEPDCQISLYTSNKLMANLPKAHCKFTVFNSSNSYPILVNSLLVISFPSSVGAVLHCKKSQFNTRYTNWIYFFLTTFMFDTLQ